MKRPSAAAVVSTGIVTEGVIRLDDKVTTAAELKTIRNGGIVLTVEPATEDSLRSTKARKYYRAVVLKRIAAAAHLELEDMHGVLSARFLGHPVAFVDPVTGEERVTIVYPSTATLDGETFWQFVQECRGFAQLAYQLEIPNPDPAWRLHQSEAA